MASVSFAELVTLGGGTTATASRTAATTAAVTTLAGGVVWSTSNPLDTDTLLGYFTIPYVLAHELSRASYRYSIILWFCIVAVIVVGSVIHVFTRRGGGSLGAWFTKYGMKRIHMGNTARPTSGQLKKRRQYVSPTLAQVIAMLAFTAAVFCLCYIGPDYLAPSTCILSNSKCDLLGISKGPPKTTYNKRLRRKSDIVSTALPLPLDPQKRLKQRWKLERRARTLNPNGWAPWNDPLLSSINTQVDKSYWSSSNRIGTIAYALVPLCTILALKQWPIAIFATPWLTDKSYNKMAFFHQWFGRLTFALTTVHVGFWTYQLFVDRDPYGDPIFWDIFNYWRFRAGVIAYAALFVMVILSFQPFRTRFYEIFYYSHCALVLMVMIGCGMHHEDLGSWCWIAAALWGLERGIRFLDFLWINGLLSGIHYSDKRSNKIQALTNQYVSEKSGKEWSPAYTPDYTPNADMHGYLRAAGHDSATTPDDIYNSYFYSMDETAPRPKPQYSTELDPPAGYAIAQLLPGRTIRLTIRTPKRIRWKTGQHVSLNMPSIRWWQGHPYTILSADDRISEATSKQGSLLIVLITVRKGFTKGLWNYLVQQRKLLGEQTVQRQQGVVLRTCVSRPMGSVGGARYGMYESVLIVCGGSGVSFGAAVFEHVCALISTSTGRTNRVRFIWLLKEFSHLTWVAPSVRRALAMCRSEHVQVEFFVTRDSQSVGARAHKFQGSYGQSIDFVGSTNFLAPPHPTFLRQTTLSYDSGRSDAESDEEGPLAPRARGSNSAEMQDLVQFDGEEDFSTAADYNLSRRVQKEGRVRRANSRKLAAGLRNKVKNAKATHDYPPRSSSVSPGPWKYDNAALEVPPSQQSIQNIRPNQSSTSLSAVTTIFRDDGEDINLDVSPQDEIDLNAVAELTRSGHPDIAGIFDQEIARATGRLMVAACGPRNLNALVRKLVSQRLSPAKIRKSDLSGAISCHVEDFDDV